MLDIWCRIFTAWTTTSSTNATNTTAVATATAAFNSAVVAAGDGAVTAHDYKAFGLAEKAASDPGGWVVWAHGAFLERYC